MRKLTVLAVPLLLLWSAVGAHASAIQIGAFFTGTDHIDWSQLPLHYQGTNSAAVTTNLGYAATVTANGPDFYAFKEDFNFIGGFALDAFGTAVLKEDGETLTIDFSTPVNAVGAHIQPDLDGKYTAELRLFTAGNVLIGGPFLLASELPPGADLGSNPFFGAMSDNADIARAVFAIIAHDGVPLGAHAGIAIDQLQLGIDAALPEPVSLSLLGLGLAGYAVRRRRAVR